MTHFAETRNPCSAAGVPGIRTSLGRFLLSASCTLQLWYERSRQRRALARLDDRLLRDIGIDRVSAMEEISKPFWLG